jgi:hypothetical protein
MHVDSRAPQLVTQIDRNERSGFFLQLAMHVFCSPLNRMGTANTDGQQSNTSDGASATIKVRAPALESSKAMSNL